MVSGIASPVINVPTPIVEYPVIDIQTEATFTQQMDPNRNESDSGEDDTRDMIPTTPTTPIINVPVLGDVPLPEPAPLITAGATAVVTTTVTLGATIAVAKLKDAVLEPALKRMNNAKKKKIKIKQVKPIIEFIPNEDKVTVITRSQNGTTIQDIENVERFLRDEVELDELYEFDNKIIISDKLKEGMTKEGQKRFKSHFVPLKGIIKKMSAKFSF